MAINVADNTPRVNYTATAGQTLFTVPFGFFEETDVNVYINGTLKTINTDYTLTGGNGSTGSITLTTGATLSDVVSITRDVTIERTSDFTEGQPISRAALNEQLDIITAQISDIDDKASRSLQLTDHEIIAPLTLPELNERKGKYLLFSETDGAPQVASIGAIGAITVPVPVSQGGTAGTNAVTARANLGTTEEAEVLALALS